MQYDYQCSKCNNVQEESCLAKDDAFRTFNPKCVKCGSLCSYIFTATVPEIAFKDGPTGSWASKSNRFKNYRNKQDEKMKKRQFDRYGAPKELIPNYKGEQLSSWEEAKSVASQDKDVDDRTRKATANSFNSHVKKEKAKSKIKV